MARLGLTRDDLALAPRVAEQHTLAGAPRRYLTIGAAVAFRAATRAERAGLTPEHAVRAARRDVVRLLDVVPPRVFADAHP